MSGIASINLLFGETKVYYVKPSADTHKDFCPGKPCHTLDYYHEHETWDNRTENITLKFLSGIYDIKSDPLPHSASCLKWIGLNPAYEIILLLHNVSIMSELDVHVPEIHFENLTFISNSSKFATLIKFSCGNTSFIGMAFSGVHLSFTQVCPKHHTDDEFKLYQLD